MHEVLVNRLGGLSLPRKSVVRLTDRPDMTLDVYRGRKTTIQQQQQQSKCLVFRTVKFCHFTWFEFVRYTFSSIMHINLVTLYTSPDVMHACLFNSSLVSRRICQLSNV